MTNTYLYLKEKSVKVIRNKRTRLDDNENKEILLFENTKTKNLISFTASPIYNL